MKDYQFWFVMAALSMIFTEIVKTQKIIGIVAVLFCWSLAIYWGIKGK